MAAQQIWAHLSRHNPGTNMTARYPGPKSLTMPQENNMADGSPGPTAPAMTQEPTWPPGSPGRKTPAIG